MLIIFSWKEEYELNMVLQKHYIQLTDFPTPAIG